MRQETLPPRRHSLAVEFDGWFFSRTPTDWYTEVSYRDDEQRSLGVGVPRATHLILSSIRSHSTHTDKYTYTRTRTHAESRSASRPIVFGHVTVSAVGREMAQRSECGHGIHFVTATMSLVFVYKRASTRATC